MDSRIAKIKALKRNAENDSPDYDYGYDAAIDDVLSLITAEPEPCEDARAFAKSVYMDVCERVEKDGYVAAGFIETYAEEIAAYASQVADKRTEELRAALSGLYHATCEADFPTIPDKYYHHVLNANQALASTEPKP